MLPFFLHFCFPPSDGVLGDEDDKCKCGHTREKHDDISDECKEQGCTCKEFEEE